MSLPLALLLLPLPTAPQQVETPRTVNDQALGTIEEFQDRGPGRICLETAAFDMLEGEVVTLQYLGIHSGSLIVTSPAGNMLVQHGDHWARNGRGLRTVWRDDARSIRREGKGSRVKYFYFAPTAYSDGKPVLIMIVSGNALNGDDRDLPRLQRLTLHPDLPQSCLRRYAYGWDMLLGDEQPSTGKTE